MADSMEVMQTLVNDAPVLLPGVAELRKCRDFHPEEHFIKVSFQDSNRESYYLEVKWRTFWFLAYCEENGLRGRIEEHPVEILPGTNLVQAVCSVYIDGDLVGKGVGGTILRDNMYAVQQAATIAKGRALANAGFGTVFSSASTNESGGQEIPCDGGLRVDEVTADFFVRSRNDPHNSMDDGEASDPTEADVAPAPVQTTPAPAPAPAQPAPAPVQFPKYQPQFAAAPQTDDKPMTFEEARDFVVNINHEYKGKTLGEVYALGFNGQRTIQYFAEKSRKADLKKAAQTYLKNL